MPKYYMTWEQDTNKMPTDPKELMAVVMKMSEMTAQALKDKKMTDWGVVIGENRGYAISEGNWQDVIKGALQFSPYIIFKVYQVASMDEISGVMKSLVQ